jgi:hypothetical protein
MNCELLGTTKRSDFPVRALRNLEEGSIAKISKVGWNAPKTQRVVSGPRTPVARYCSASGMISDHRSRTARLRLWNMVWAWIRGGTRTSAGGIVAWLTDPGAAPHGGESSASLIDRIGRWMVERTDDGHTVAVTHPAVIRSAVVHSLEYFGTVVLAYQYCAFIHSGSAVQRESLDGRSECLSIE